MRPLDFFLAFLFCLYCSISRILDTIARNASERSFIISLTSLFIFSSPPDYIINYTYVYVKTFL